MSEEKLFSTLSQYVAAKAEETRAKNRRRELGDELASMLEHPQEGSKAHTLVLPEEGTYSVTVKGVVNRKVDWEAFERITADWTHAPVQHKPSLDVVGLKWLHDNDPEKYLALCECITAKPGQTQVTVKEKK